MAPTFTVSYELHPPEGTQSADLSPTKTHQIEVKPSEGQGYRAHYDALRSAIADTREKTGEELTAWRDAVGNKEQMKEPNKASKDEEEDEDEDEDEEEEQDEE